MVLNTTKTKEMVIDRRPRHKAPKPPIQPINIGGEDIEMVRSYKYLGVHLDDKMDWTINSDALYKKGQSRLYFLRKLRSFEVCREMLVMFYQAVMASVIFFAAVGWGGNVSKRDSTRLNRLQICRGETDAKQVPFHLGQCFAPPSPHPG